MFKLAKIENGRINVGETVVYEATASEAVSYGEALVLASGKLTKCGATAKPAYVAGCDVTADDTKRAVPCLRVTPDMVFLVPVTAAPTSLVPGSKVTLHTDGMKVTATTTGGIATVVDTNGATAAGDEILVRFE